MSIVNAFIGFLTKYGEEATSISDALKTLISAIPIPIDEKITINATIDKLTAIPASVEASLTKLDTTPVVINETDIDNAVKNVLQPMVDAAVAKALADATTKSDQNQEHTT